VRFRRKKAQPETAADVPEGPGGPESTDDAGDPGTVSGVSGEAATAAGDGPDQRPEGPWDAGEVELDEEAPGRVDLGGLLITGREGLELRLQVDEGSQQVAAVLLVGKEGAVELRPFAAPRNGDIWDDVRQQIADETGRRGGTATEADGVYGKELRVVMPVQTQDGRSGTQASRVFGIRGPRWLLRATFLGKPAVEPKHDGVVESALRDVVVVRGNDPMAPGEPIPLRMPPNAERVS